MSGSVEAGFDFISYKIDAINLKISNKLSTLLNTEPVKPENVLLNIALRSTEKFSAYGRIIYVGGLSTKIVILSSQSPDEMLNGVFSISGMFTPVNSIDILPEETFAKINIPAILMPHLRATMTNVLSNAGFGTVLFPLVNIHELAKKYDYPVIDRTQETVQLPEQPL